ncbi:hypothetical protein E2C01_039685 [Portunus trituberculatus]|uniref:Uncharacterized protein n=1 Tax=Portunus trituberculatus TaxID=210409 RepID=A0A5B7FLE0_PORTR|nr:hypothetical protein [Portunus trituberculatus]
MVRGSPTLRRDAANLLPWRPRLPSDAPPASLTRAADELMRPHEPRVSNKNPSVGGYSGVGKEGGAAGARRQGEAAEVLAAVPRQERCPPGGTARDSRQQPSAAPVGPDRGGHRRVSAGTPSLRAKAAASPERPLLGCRINFAARACRQDTDVECSSCEVTWRYSAN